MTIDEARSLMHEWTKSEALRTHMERANRPGFWAESGVALLKSQWRPFGFLPESGRRRSQFWSHCNSEQTLEEPIRDPAQFLWQEVTKVQHYYLDVDAMTRPMQVRKHPPGSGGGE